jgi:hypothetical protein
MTHVQRESGMIRTPQQQAWLDRMDKLNAAMDEAGKQFRDELRKSPLPLGGFKSQIPPDDLDWVGSLQSYEWGE